MKKCILSICLVVMVLFIVTRCSSPQNPKKEIKDFNLRWNFYLSQDSLDNTPLESSHVMDGWENVDLPHDWVIKGEFDSANVDTAPATGYIYGGGVGWYQKRFDFELTNDQRVFVLFDGVYNNSEVYINGHSLGFHPYGYSPFYYDLTDYLKKEGKDNVLTVKCDHSRYADSRWYTGAGIYRKVDLIVKNKLDIPIWGTFITTPTVSETSATVDISIEVENGYDQPKMVLLETDIVAQDGAVIVTIESDINIESREKKKIKQTVDLSSPKLWGLENPYLYKAVTRIKVKEDILSTYETTFGIREFSFDANTGFTLNGESMKIKGGCIHHDGGLVGTAVPKGVWKRRLQTLKDGGMNAIRIAHNPARDELLDLCDEIGILVQDEFFDEWDNPKDKRWNQQERMVDYVSRGYGEHFQNWAERDLKTVVKAHRNHPSIFQWSIGNEIEWTYPRMSVATGFFNNMNWNGNYFWSEPPYSTEEIRSQLDQLPKGEYSIGKTAKKLVEWTKEMDTTRPTIANCILPSASHETDYGKSLDIVGYSYRRVLYDYGHKNYPDKVIMGTENLPRYHEWKAIEERPWISGTFLWTAIDYMGEIRAPWPKKGISSGLIDYAGFTKTSYYMMKSLWSNEATIHIATQNIEKSLNKIDQKTGLLVAKNPDAWKTSLWEWQELNNHWEYEEGEVISVEVYSNCDEVELFLNDKSQGIRKLEEFEDHVYKWAVTYSGGELKAVGRKGAQTMIEVLKSVSEPVAVKLEVDNSNLLANGHDVTHLIAQVIDANGNPVKTKNRRLTFQMVSSDKQDSVESTGMFYPSNSNGLKENTVLKILGVDNGSAFNVQKHYSSEIVTDKGRALLILQAGLLSGDVNIIVKSEGLKSESITVNVSK